MRQPPRLVYMSTKAPLTPLWRPVPGEFVECTAIEKWSYWPRKHTRNMYRTNYSRVSRLKFEDTLVSGANGDQGAAGTLAEVYAR